jgi:hypothetical protein
MKPFVRSVPTLDEGLRLVETLGLYDLFQLENRVKPDFCNAGGVQMLHPTGTDGEWWDVPEDDDELRDILDVCAAAPAPSK